MRTDDFDFVVPNELIARFPAPERAHSRLLLLHRENGGISHHQFFELPSLLRTGDVLVYNDSQVFPARLRASKHTGGRVEIVLLRRFDNAATETWEAIVSGKRMRAGTNIRVRDADGEMICAGTLLERLTEHSWKISFDVTGSAFRSVLERVGETPIPPYMKDTPLHEESLRAAYQTVFATHEGSSAAPTAGLHFTDELLKALDESGIERVAITLHVGLGTFLPVQVEDIAKHTMHREHATVSEATAKKINHARAEGRRIIAIGTTSARTLESFMRNGQLHSGEQWTDIFMAPGYQFQCIDGLITNFHLPKSTLFMLISAFVGLDSAKKAYAEAIENKYRFYSFGDAMLIL